MRASWEPISLKSEVLTGLRDVLRGEQFVEVMTPVLRRADLGSGRRLPVAVGGGRFLRAMIGPALRVNLEHHPRIFEIGQCFRPDKADDLHAMEFAMLDLYAAHEDFEFLLSLAERLVAPYLAAAPARVSVAGHIRDVFGIDLWREPMGDLPHRLADRVAAPPQAAFKDVLGRFIEEELEAASRGSAVFLTDFPLGGEEPCARLTPGTVAVLNRFELIVDGIEVIHGYEDETDTAAFTQRAIAVGLYDDEQRLAQHAVAAGRVPAASVGLGIGIERLCAVAAGVRDIRPFQQSAQF